MKLSIIEWGTFKAGFVIGLFTGGLSMGLTLALLIWLTPEAGQ